jgi:hypothetical protein
MRRLIGGGGRVRNYRFLFRLKPTESDMGWADHCVSYLHFGVTKLVTSKGTLVDNSRLSARIGTANPVVLRRRMP